MHCAAKMTNAQVKSTETKDAPYRDCAKGEKNKETKIGMMKIEARWGKEGKINGLGRFVLKEKRVEWIKETRYFKDIQTSIYLICTSRARTHIYLLNIYMDYSDKFGNVTQYNGHRDIHATSMIGESVTAFLGTSLIWFQSIIGVRITTTTTIGWKIKICGKCAEFLLSGCQLVSSNVKLMGKSVMMNLIWVHVIAQTSDPRPLMATFWQKYSSLASV